ncbi:MAG: MGMT family protein [Ignavibacteriales bacterium]|nr:MGMT family protein [Ignavibacteriales bacterium]
MSKSSLAPKSYEIILETVKKIPRGKVATYGEIARLSGLLNQARLVGYALHSIPNKSKIPWHRVINSQGKISFQRSSSVYHRQRSLLKKEGVYFDKDRIEFKKFGWLYGKMFEEKNKR